VISASRSAKAEPAGRPGRVESVGTLEEAAVVRELRQVLPQVLAEATRPQMEWYRCQGAFFHNDAHYGGVLFGIWTAAGPPREVVFPRISRRVPVRRGSIVVFDPFEPHAVLNAGASTYRREDYEGAEANLFLGFEVDLSPQVRVVFGIGEGGADRPTLSSRVAINPETGAFATSGA